MSITGSNSTEGEVMAPEVTTTFRGLLSRMKLPNYQGNPAEFHDWLIVVQKKQLVYRLMDRKMVQLAYEAAAGSVSKFIGALYRENSQMTWDELKGTLIRRYTCEQTTTEAVRKLFRIKQEVGETLEDLGDKMTRLAELAFPNLEIRENEAIQVLFADAFMDAIRDIQRLFHK